MSYYCTWYIRSVTAIPSHVLLHDEIIPFEYFFGGWMPVVFSWAYHRLMNAYECPLKAS